jgi:3-oxoacyl-[acyl-carrier-protein] synthase-1
MTDAIDVVVVGVGAATPIGQSALASAAAVRAAIAGFGDHPFMIDARGDPFQVAIAPFLDPLLDADLRMMALGRMAALEAVAVATDPVCEGELGLFIGLPQPRPGLTPLQAPDIVDAIGSERFGGLHVSSVQAFVCGHSAGLMAIAAACRSLRDGSSRFALAGGVDSHISAHTLEWLDQLDRLHIPINAWGFMPGEAAGFCLLCSAATARENGLTLLARIAATSTADEPHRIYTDAVCLGEGLTQAVQRVLGFMPKGAQVDATYCDQNGEAYRADECGFMLSRSSERFVDPTDFESPADCWGDVGAASGPLFAMLAVVAARKGYAKGRRSLLWTSSEGGQRGALLLEAEPVQVRR